MCILIKYCISILFNFPDVVGMSKLGLVCFRQGNPKKAFGAALVFLSEAPKSRHRKQFKPDTGPAQSSFKLVVVMKFKLVLVLLYLTAAHVLASRAIASLDRARVDDEVDAYPG